MIHLMNLTLALTIPITLGALCGTISERGGIIMLGVEGMMLMGAFSAVLGSYVTGSAIIGVLIACSASNSKRTRALLAWVSICLQAVLQRYCLKQSGDKKA